MREAIMVGGQTFATKKELEERLRSMLQEAVPGVEFDQAEHDFLMCALFRHPEAIDKVGAGVRAFRVTTTQYKNRCFEVVRIDGTTQEFSYLKCARGESSESKTA